MADIFGYLEDKLNDYAKQNNGFFLLNQSRKTKDSIPFNCSHSCSIRPEQDKLYDCNY